MAEHGTAETLLGEVGKALLPLGDALSSPERFAGLMQQLGWQVDAVPAPLLDLAGAVDDLHSALRRVLGDDFGAAVQISAGTGGASATVSLADVARLADAITRIVSGIRGLATAPDGAFSAPLVADGFKTKLPRQLLDHLVVNYLTRHQAPVAFALRALGVVKTAYVPATATRPSYVDYDLDLGALPDALEDPSVVLRNAYGWGTADFDVRTLFAQLDSLLSTIGVDTAREPMRPAHASALQGGTIVPGDPVPRALKGVVFERSLPSVRMQADIRLLPLPQAGAQLPGLALMPAFDGQLGHDFHLGDDVSVEIRSDLSLQGGIALLLRPGEGIDLVLGFDTPGAPTSAKGSIDVGVSRTGLEDAPHVLLGQTGGTRLEYAKVGGRLGVRLVAGTDVDLFGEAELKGLAFVFSPAGGDGFIAKLFPGDGFRFGTDLTVGLSHRTGFYFRGSSHLEITVPAHVALGPLELKGLTIGANPGADGLPISLGVTAAANLGPLRAVVENVGLTAKFAFPEGGGNLGVADLSLAFKPPNGVGLSLDAGVVKGGGYLYFDFDREEYAGALELEFLNTLSLKAIGLLTTRMPDGSKGFSLLIIISVEFGTGIQLSWGFTLLAVGGLVGLNRTMNLQALMEGVRTGALESVMFPKDVVANAPKIISDLRTIFPPQEGTFLIGPMLKLGWGTPTLVSVSLGVIIEIPGNVAIVGILKLAIPADEIALIVIQVNFAGAIEFDKKRLYFFAALFESRIVFMTIEGEMGLLLAWGDDANFVLSVGGFHPRFSPPALPFPSPKRIAVSLLSTPVSKLRIEGYFAVTTNTVQFGARVEVFFGLSILNVKGHLQFDALFQFSPFKFVIDISASLSVNVFGAGVFSVSINGSLDGPSPWHVVGHGSISLLFWDVDVDFEKTWGEQRDTTLEPIDVLPKLATAVREEQSWRAELPPASGLLVSLRELPPAESDRVLHPLGVLRLSQRALPLELKLDRVGQQRPRDVNRLSIAVTGGGLGKRADTFEAFAPAQFQDMSDAEKLSRPAFGPERAGLDLAAAGPDTRSTVMVKRVIRYEEIVIDSNFKRFRRPFRTFLGVLFIHFLDGAAIARNPLSHAAGKQLKPFDERIEVNPETFSVVFAANLSPVAANAVAFHSEASAREFMAGHAAAAALQVVPSFEMAA